MRKLILLILLVGLQVTIFGQNRIQSRSQRPAPRTESSGTQTNTNLKDKLWYGGGLGLGFSGNGQQSLFLLGLSPMVGYKITPIFSVGPRLEVSYAYFGYRISQNAQGRLNLFSYGIGPFTRVKITDFIFAHGEYQFESRALPLFTGGGFERIRDFQTNLFLGVGYNTGGTEMMLVYNFFAGGRNFLQPPFDLRFGFTFNY